MIHLNRKKVQPLVLAIGFAFMVGAPAIFSQEGRATDGIADSMPVVDDSLLPGLESSAVPADPAALDSSGSGEGFGSSESGEQPSLLNQTTEGESDGFFNQLFRFDRNMINLVIVAGLFIIFILYRIRSGKGRGSK